MEYAETAPGCFGPEKRLSIIEWVCIFSIKQVTVVASVEMNEMGNFNWGPNDIVSNKTSDTTTRSEKNRYNVTLLGVPQPPYPHSNYL